MIARLLTGAALLLVSTSLSALPADQETVHVVEEGETLNGIANRAKVNRDLIIEANGLTDPYIVRIGQKLKIPREKTDQGKAPAATPAAAAPVVRQSAEPRFAWPLSGPLRRGFKARSESQYHDGIDIVAKRGEAVRAIAGGKVIFARKDPDQFGNLVIVEHGDGWHSAYGSLDRITVKQGDQVGKGERVGLVGDTSITRKTELHFEMRKDGKPVDPVNHLPGQP